MSLSPFNVVYNDDGLLITLHSTGPSEDNVLDLMIFQMLINGRKPTKLPGSQNNRIVVTY